MVNDMKHEEVKVGMCVSYKRQGDYGHYDAEVMEVGKRIKIKISGWCGIEWTTPSIRFVNAKSLRP